jgi:hypothetical protein
MNTSSRAAAAVLLLLGLTTFGGAQDAATRPESAPAPNSCVMCHSDPERWNESEKRFLVTEAHFASDIHWQRGLRCTDCHGGDPKDEEYAGAHSKTAGFASGKKPADIPDFCGKCHSDTDYMRRFQPSARVDQVTEYWTSGHGKKLKTGDEKVAHCVSCHGGHGVRAVEDLASPVYPTRVAETCGKCHSDAHQMEGRTHNGKPIGHGQPALWRDSVHGQAMLKKGDVAAPTCNDCHGNHGALAPEVGSVANACGTCHGKIADLFRGTRMRHSFAEVGLPGCATCHGYHDIHHPTDEMLGVGPDSVCAKCHVENKFGATASGALVAADLRKKIESLKADISEAERRLAGAERLGMEVRAPRFELGAAKTALTNARSLIHAFAAEPVEKAVADGRAVAEQVKLAGDRAMEEHTRRRVWLGWSLAVILAMVGILVFCIRRIPLPG